MNNEQDFPPLMLSLHIFPLYVCLKDDGGGRGMMSIHSTYVSCVITVPLYTSYIIDVTTRVLRIQLTVHFLNSVVNMPSSM